MPNAKYKLTAWVKTQNVWHSSEINDVGADICVDDGFYSSTYTGYLRSSNLEATNN